MRISELELGTHRFEEMKDFYSNVLGFKLVTSHDGLFKVQTGSSALTFRGESDVQPFYHFAFNIPENLLSESMRWLAERGVEFLSTEDGEIEVDQGPKWNAHSCYFHDPAGNIVEFIARHDLKYTASEFTVDEVLYISEIRLPVTDVESVVEELHLTCGVEVWRSENNPRFVAVGDNKGMVIVVDHKRPWFPSHELPVVSPIKGVIQTGIEGVWELKSRLCEITSI